MFSWKCITLVLYVLSSLQLIYSGCCNCSEDNKNNEPEGFNDFKEFLKKEETKIIDYIKNDLRNAGINLNSDDFQVRYCWTDDILRQICNTKAFKLTLEEYDKLGYEEKNKANSEFDKIDDAIKIIVGRLYKEFIDLNSSGKDSCIFSVQVKPYDKFPAATYIKIWVFVTYREGVVTKEILEKAGFSVGEDGFVRKVA